MIEDIFKENADFLCNSINIFSNKSVRHKKYFINAQSFDPEIVVEFLFYIIYEDLHKFGLNDAYCTKNKIEL